MPRRLDSRLAHLLKLEAEARRDVQRYVLRKWPVGSFVSYEHIGQHRRGEVTRHDVINALVVVLDGEHKRKLFVPYAKIKDRRQRT